MRIERIFLKLCGAKLFSTLDVRSGYYNITIAEIRGKIQPLQLKIASMNFFEAHLASM